MRKYYSKFWIAFTLILSVVFIALFVPVTAEKIGFLKAIFFAFIALLVIWGVYFIRASVFSKFDRNNKE
jgi:hypothetical protein